MHTTEEKEGKARRCITLHYTPPDSFSPDALRMTGHPGDYYLRQAFIALITAESNPS